MLWCYCIKGLMKISYYLHVDCLASGGNLSQTRKWLVSFLGSSPGYHQTKKCVGWTINKFRLNNSLAINGTILTIAV